jgi:hypothetical protein
MTFNVAALSRHPRRGAPAHIRWPAVLAPHVGRHPRDGGCPAEQFAEYDKTVILAGNPEMPRATFLIVYNPIVYV